MKILYIIPYINYFGGIQQFAKTQKGFLENGNDIDVIGWTSPLRLFEVLIMSCMPKAISQKIFSHIIHGGLDRNIFIDQYEVVNCWHVDIAMALPRIKKMVIVCHGLEILEPNVKRYKRGEFITALNNAQAIIANSEFTKRYLDTHYLINQHKITIIHPGVDLNKFKYIPTKNKDDIFVIGTLTRFVKRKNISNIIKALVILKNKYNLDFVYNLAGDGPERKKITRELKRSEIKYKYFGAISERDKTKEFYPSLDVFVLPPLETKKDVEGFGIVFLEANACGVPVIAADTGGVADAVRENISGLFANPLDPEDIAEKIYEILTSKKDYRKSSRKWAENFSQEKTAAKFQTLYEKVIHQTG
jgi:phosphatidylinositol alpha-1,6-mannosyltransferase